MILYTISWQGYDNFLGCQSRSTSSVIIWEYSGDEWWVETQRLALVISPLAFYGNRAVTSGYLAGRVRSWERSVLEIRRLTRVVRKRHNS